MRDADCIAFLQWALPRLGFRWPGFRKVRRQVCKRIGRRMRELGISDPHAYRSLVQGDPDEQRILDGFCRITVSRFCRDRRLFEALGAGILPSLVTAAERRGETIARAWSAGCGAGEEPYSLSLVHTGSVRTELRATTLQIVATDADPHQLQRARAGVYPPSSLREVGPELRLEAFEEVGAGLLRLRDRYREGVEFRCQDLRRTMPRGPFHLILCRNLAFTYFDDDLQVRVLERLLERLATGGALVVGAHEHLPQGDYPLEPWSPWPAFRRSR